MTVETIHSISICIIRHTALVLALYLQLVSIPLIKGTCNSSDPCKSSKKKFKKAILCPGDNISPMINATNTYNACHPKGLSDLYRSKVTVVGDFSGCGEVKTPEIKLFSHMANNLYDTQQAVFIQSFRRKDMTCAELSQDLHENFEYKGWAVNDIDYAFHNDFFMQEEELSYPSYLILDDKLQVRYKLTGPCCGEKICNDCDISTVLDWNYMFHNYINTIISENNSADDARINNDCNVGDWSEWSSCCDEALNGIKIRWKKVEGTECPSAIETKECQPDIECQKSENYSKAKNDSSSTTSSSNPTSLFPYAIMRIIVFAIAVIVLLIPIIYYQTRKYFKKYDQWGGDGDTVIIGKEGSDVDSVK